MSNKISKEWFINAPWGKLAAVSWGNPANPPILMVHGYMDSAATFILLVEELPDTYYYVGFDLPGHGKSDFFPSGPMITHMHMVEAVRCVVEHMQWNSFVYMGHSIGYLIGAYYNGVFPGKISKMISIDPAPAFAMTYLIIHQVGGFIQTYYNKYDKTRYFVTPPKTYTYDEAISDIIKKRKISKKQAEVLLSRSLLPCGDGRYRLSWDPIMSNLQNFFMSDETQIAIITKNPPPTLIFNATEYMFKGRPPVEHEEVVAKIMKKIKFGIPDFTDISVNGEHDVHVTNPEEMAPDIVNFLGKDRARSIKKYNKAKL